MKLVMVYVDQSPNFEKVIRIHTAAKKSAFNEFKQPNTAATLLGITEKVFARVTGAVLVANDDDPVCMRKVNIGLQLKVRGFVSTHLVQSSSGIFVPLINHIWYFLLSAVSIGHRSFTRFCETKR